MKKTLICFLSIVLFASCKSTSGIQNTKSSNLSDKIVDAALENLGSPYKYAGTTKSGFDCSGLVYTTFERFNIKLPRSSFEQSKIGTNLDQKIEKAQKGDLVFFRTNSKSSKINHVGIVTESKGEDLKFIHSSTSQGVIISSLKEPYYQKTFTQLNRILQ